MSDSVSGGISRSFEMSGGSPGRLRVCGTFWFWGRRPLRSSGSTELREGRHLDGSPVVIVGRSPAVIQSTTYRNYLAVLAAGMSGEKQMESRDSGPKAQA